MQNVNDLKMFNTLVFSSIVLFFYIHFFKKKEIFFIPLVYISRLLCNFAT
ncbi:hypothetical protein HMPREF1870_01638 [Bacteroidales bacterium KA00344]|nr:hypothetical protein HMPREF1870_01638 [Bacteroidales bacterium KA00344]